MTAHPSDRHRAVDEGNMDRELSTHRAGSRRRSRPMSRVQEIVVLTVIFAVGAAFQAAYLLNAGALLQ